MKEVTTGVKEIELDQKPEVPLSDLSEAVELPAALVTETSVEADEEVKTDTDEDPTPEQRPGEVNAPELEGSQDPVKGDSTEEIPVIPMQEPTDNSRDTIKTSEEDSRPLIVDPTSPTKVSQSKSSVKDKEPVALGDTPEVKA